jgi:hypothetical protein
MKRIELKPLIPPPLYPDFDRNFKLIPFVVGRLPSGSGSGTASKTSLM